MRRMEGVHRTHFMLRNTFRLSARAVMQQPRLSPEELQDDAQPP